MTRSITLGIAVIAAVGASAGLALSQDAPHVEGNGGPPVSDRVFPTGPAADARGDRAARYPAARTLGVLRRPRTAGDRIPDALQKTPLLNDGVADVASARRANGGRGEAWLIPRGKDGHGEESVCLLTPGHLGCPPLEVIERDGFAASLSWRPGHAYVGGVASDDVKTLRLTFRDGSEQELAIVDNVAVYVTDDRRKLPTELAWHGPHGPKSQSFFEGDPDW